MVERACKWEWMTNQWPKVPLRLRGDESVCGDTDYLQMILSIDEQMPCIIMDLDETHVLVNSTLVEQLRTMLDTEFEKNTYTLDI